MWASVPDQSDITDQLDTALEKGITGSTWIFSGPVGSGREIVAKEFAKKILGVSSLDDNHDVLQVRTSGLSIGIDTMREAVEFALLYPQSHNFRIIIVHDADRMTTDAMNAILKAVEEPSQTTIWMLITPSSTDLLPTIRSRSRIVHLKTPKLESIINTLVKEGHNPKRAEIVAKLSGGHVGVARVLVASDESLNNRLKIIDYTLDITNISDAVFFTEEIIEDAKVQYEKHLDEKYQKLEEDLLERNGVSAGERVPAYMKKAISNLDNERKTEEKRSLKDYLDIRLMQMELVYRDLILIKLGATEDLLINYPALNKMQQVATRKSLDELKRCFDCIRAARKDLLETNAVPKLVLESLFVKLI